MADTTETVVTSRVGMNTDKQLSQVIVVTMTPLAIACTRALRVYIQTLVGLLTVTSTGLASAIASKVGVTLTFTDFWHALLASASIAFAPAAISFLQNIVELLNKWDASHPMLRA